MPTPCWGPKAKGYGVLEHIQGYALLALAADALGAMDVAKQHTLEYLQTRKQFGVAIGTFQALQHRMADLLLEVGAGALGRDQRRRRHRQRRRRGAQRRRWPPPSTPWATWARWWPKESIQMHGGIGMTWELPLAHYAKRLVMIDHQLGDEDHHLARFIALSQAV